VEHEPIRFDTPDIDLADDEPAPPVKAPRKKPTPAARSLAETSTSQWSLPDMAILQRTKEHKLDRAAVDAAGDELVAALAAHGVETTLVGYTVGPTVTRFELELGAGVKVARVTSLNRDIAYAMASPDVRILAPIPGRSAIGVEVPNRQRQLVALGDLLASEEAIDAHHPLDVPLGRDISGQTVVVNLAEMPHVLISGATGAGKSSCINGLITSLVMRATPDTLKLILVDPKRVELGQYNDLPHLLSPVVVDPKKAAGALAWAVKEMERRYDILAHHGVRDLTSYQQMVAAGKIVVEPSSEERSAELVEEVTGVVVDRPAPAEPESLPYIVIVVDELNDLMMVAARDVEESVVRIAQMARAVGIHLVLATQRPSVDVITGVIKANIPSRMAFAVSSLADSRVILDQAGAERLIGKGDMLLLTASSNIARRLQSPWVSEEEVRNVVLAWTAQGGRAEPVVASDITSTKLVGTGSGAETGDEDDDEILKLARELVVRTQSGSVSMLQRKLRVGFARAGRIMDMLENEGTVGPGEGSKSRKVLMTVDEWEREQGDQ
jgi:S-DNA-T family DNA segregation ATPase FtsK/SpoIIIE